MVAKIAVIGVGAWATNHLRILSNLECKLVALADIDPSKQRIAEQYGAKFFTNYEDALNLVDAVSIVAPTHLHYEIVKKALEKGKHVFVEKPLTLNYQQGKKLVKIAKAENVSLMVGHLFRFNAGVLKLRNLLLKTGNINYITARFIHSHKPPRKDSGVIFNFGSHLIDTMSFLLEEKPKRVYCSKVNCLGNQREDFASITLKYDGFVANLEMSWLHPLKKRDVWVIAENEKIYADLLEQSITSYPIKMLENRVVRGAETEIKFGKNEPLFEELKYFVNLVNSNKTFVDEAALETVRLCEKCLISAKQGKEIAV